MNKNVKTQNVMEDLKLFDLPKGEEKKKLLENIDTSGLTK